MLTTNDKGSIAEMALARVAIEHGLGVWLPLVDEPSDLLLDTRPRLLRVQCKWACRTRDVISIWTRRCRRGRHGHIHRQYGPCIRWARDYEFGATLARILGP